MTFEDRLRQKVIEEELLKRKEIKPLDILSEALPYQKAFIQDPALWKAVCAERRSGKTMSLILALINVCLNLPNARCTYFSLTNESCRRILEPGFNQIILKHKIAARFTSKYEIRFDNGSIIYLLGLNSSPEDINKARGQASDLTVIDECQDIDQDLRHIIQAVLKMTLLQRRTPLILAGTPGNKQGLHYWYQINKPESTETEFKLFKFHWKDNTAIDEKSGLRVCDAIQEAVDKDIARNPLITLTPEFRQEILGEWVIETSARIYRYEPNANDVVSAPSPAFLKDATFILGFDLGYHPDPTALVVGCFNLSFDHNLYILLSEEHDKMITADLAKRIKELDRIYHFQSIVGDSANLNIIGDLNRTYNIPTIKADKAGKLAHQNMINSDFLTQRIKLFREGTVKLSEQLQTVIWDKHALLLGKKVEDGKFDNHCTDALLYLHFFSRHHWFTPKKEKTTLTNQDHYDGISKKLLSRNKPTGLFKDIDFSEPNKT